ncbi:hypothetical protein EMGBS15_17570 [Filimonas sp.]|nr:hypothetical protein EMGBS15_17570 [Filimonas sp.]
MSWVTSNELNNSHFVIERSKDAKSFIPVSSKITSKAPGGNSQTDLSYAFNDISPLNGHNYYRLQQTDMDGHISYSHVVDVYFGQEMVVNMYPNPVSSILSVDIQSIVSSKTYIKISDATGRLVRQVEISLIPGSNNTQLDMKDLSDGVYLVNVTNNVGLNFTQTIRKK